MKTEDVAYQPPEVVERLLLDDDAAKEQGKQSSHAAPPDKSYTFELSVSSSSEWPESCSGVRAVLSAVQELLEAASDGNPKGFDASTISLEEAVHEWREGLFGEGA